MDKAPGKGYFRYYEQKVKNYKSFASYKNHPIGVDYDGVVQTWLRYEATFATPHL